MTRCLTPVFLSMALLAPLLAPGNAGAENRPAATGQNRRAAGEAVSRTKSNDGRIPVTRSDGSTGFTRPPDPKEIRRLVGYMRQGMNRADRSDRQTVTRRVIQYRRVNRTRR